MNQFKVWYKIKKEWEKRPCVIDQEGKLFVVRTGVVIGLNTDNHEVCWNTGLEDKNGREIYEGDILKDQKGIGYVEWVVEHCAFVAKAVKNGDVISYHLLESDGQLKNTEVIGNRWDNPELLGQTND